MSPPFAPNLIRRLRRIPLTAVLQAAGACQDRDDKARWHTAAGAISVTGTKFFNWNTATGGGGAIDLAMHLYGFDFKAAAVWLCRHFPNCRDIPVVVPQPSALRLPAPAPGHLAKVVQYLVGERHIPHCLVTQLIDVDDLYADHRANAVFLTRDQRRDPVGAELRGTGPHLWRGMAPGSRKDEGYFCVRDTRCQAAIICESAIDAISCLAIHPRHCCVSTAGARPNPAWLPSLISQYPRIYCGFDADPTGDAMASAMCQTYPAIARLRPRHHDWNDQLRAQR